ncbi:MAG: methyltransferase domain-containing protein [Bacteriovoracaceae bacterium]|nr:methyltransferase domain-containing protein [Bacteriovoracaceae bacterium]
MDLKELRSTTINRHPWEKSRARFFKNIIEKHIPRKNNVSKILDIGSGDGHFARNLLASHQDNFQIHCLDINYTYDFIGQHSHEKIKYIREHTNDEHDFIILMDVLEHIEDDSAALSDIINRNMKNDSCFLITVPAWNFLYSKHDLKLGHIRRYSPSMGKKLISDAGLEIIESGGLFHSLVIPRYLMLLRERIFGASEEVSDLGNWNHGYLFTSLMDFAFRVDNICSKIFSLLNLQVPGLTWWAVGRKKR